ncbi:hypothetical protein TOPH_08951 [Tolypocladium ophioglossoides CBS 100239]|uniref:Uncharacterized protein n=1 Tax=Tolypocladium ophioglossoides (strain CBS 100239) TaxID=1163406 RepID=A0A0L0MY73_TOLOC|nr:hypothetical protein TOPH_08951 [Tolypocladium ophioglossoides CBS 100239]
MLPFWTLAILLVTGAFANKESGKYQVILYYRVRQFMVNALGEGGNRIAPGCKSPCDMEAFLNEVSNVNTCDGKKPATGPDGKRILINDPDFKKIDFSKLTDDYLKDLNAAGKELDKSGFKGLLLNGKLFNGWSGGNSLPASAIDDTRDALHCQGKDPSGGHFDEIKDSLQAAADARRINYADYLTEAFKKELLRLNKDFEVVLTDAISHPPVDIEETIKKNAGEKGMAKNEEKIRQFVNNYNNSKKGLNHLAAIQEMQGLRNKLELPFGQCKQ